MTKFENKVTAIEDVENKPHKLTYLKLVKVSASEVPMGAFGPIGISGEEMKKRIRILEVVEKAELEYLKSPIGEPFMVEFEDADFDQLKKCVNDKKWPNIHKEIVEFIEYVSSLKPEPINESSK